MADRSVEAVSRRALVAVSGAALIGPIIAPRGVSAQSDRDRAEAASAQVRDPTSGAPEVPSILTKLNRDGSNVEDASAFRAAIGANLAANVHFTPTEEPALERSVQDKLRDIVSVKDFGAIGDGTSRALSAIFDSLAAARTVYPFVTSLTQTQDWAGIMQALGRSRTVHIPAGTYRCGRDEVTVTRPTRITGDGPHLSIIARDTSGNGINLDMSQRSVADSSDTRIDGIALVNTMAAGTATSGAGIYGQRGYFSEITNVRITNFHDGILFVQCPVTNIRGLNITTFTRYGFASLGNHGFDCRITDFVISGQLLIDGAPTAHGSKGIFLENMNDEFVFLNGIVNYCRVGLYTDAATFAVNACPEFARFINVSFDSNSLGMDLANCADMVFQACFISNRPNAGAIIGQRGPTRNIQFFGCTFQTNGGNGAMLFPGARFTNFIGCNIQGNSASAGPGVMDGAVAHAGVADFTFVGCHFDNGWGGGTQKFGLHIADPTCDRFAVVGNHFSAAQGGLFVNKSRGLDQNIVGNIGYLTELRGVADYDPPRFAPGDGGTMRVRVPGATLDDFVVGVSFSDDLQGVTAAGWVSEADTVTVRFTNAAGAVVNLAQGTVRVRVSRR